MSKKEYIVPSIKMVKMESISILDGTVRNNGLNSPGTEGVIPDLDDDDYSAPPSSGH